MEQLRWIRFQCHHGLPTTIQDLIYDVFVIISNCYSFNFFFDPYLGVQDYNLRWNAGSLPAF